MSVLPTKLHAIGRFSSRTNRIPEQSSPNDFQTAILYDSERLELLSSAHHWLTKTPDVYSKDFDSIGVRTVTIGHFRDRATSKEILHFNAHLDVGSEWARREQAKILRRMIEEWSGNFKDAIVFLTGDFNASPGHQCHCHLTEMLQDAHEVCTSIGGSDSDENCRTNPVAVSFHGWLGSIVNRYLSRALVATLFTVHAMGFKLPHRVPTSLRELFDLVTDSNRYRYRYSIFESFPSSLSHLHVDWILFKSTSTSSTLKPKLVVVADVRDEEFSSDHFPIVATFNITNQK